MNRLVLAVAVLFLLAPRASAAATAATSVVRKSRLLRVIV